MNFFLGGPFWAKNRKSAKKWHFLKIIRFERKTRRWNRLAPKNSISLTDWKNFKDCGFYGHIGKKKIFASTLLSIKSAIFKIFPIRQKYWILWGRPVPTPCFALKSDDFWQNATFLADFRFLAQKGPPKKKFNKNAWLYLMNFDYLSNESNLLFLGHPHICERGGPLSLYTVFRP